MDGAFRKLVRHGYFQGRNLQSLLSLPPPVKPGANGASGVVPGGANFHVGVTFSEADFGVPDAVIVSKVTLLDGGGTPLELQPRMVAYDTGALDAGDGITPSTSSRLTIHRVHSFWATSP